MPEAGGGVIDISICWRWEIEPFDWLCNILDEQELDDSDDVPQADDMIWGFISGSDMDVAFNVCMTYVLFGIKDDPVFAWEATNSLCKRLIEAGLKLDNEVEVDVEVTTGIESGTLLGAGNSSGTISGLCCKTGAGVSAGDFSETGTGTGRLDDEDELCSTPGNTFNEGPTGWDNIAHGFLPGTTFLFNVGVNKGYDSNKGVGLEVDRYGSDGTKDDTLVKIFVKSGLVPEDGVDSEYGNFEIWTVFKIDEAVPHGGLADKIFEELEVETGAHGNDVVCGFETEAEDCEAFDVDGEVRINLSEVCVLPECKVENAGDDKSWIREFKMFMLSVGADGVVGINGIDPSEDVFGWRVGVEDMAEPFAWTLDELELRLNEESEGEDIVFETGMRCEFEVESDVEGQHGWDEPCLWLRNEHEKALS